MTFRNWLVGAIIASCVAATGAGAALGQEISESHLAAARNAVAAIKATDRFDEILPNLALSLKSELIGNNPDLESQINDVVDAQTIALVSRRADLEVEAARAYAKAISEEHLLAIAEFYKSDAGKALLENGVIVAREVQEASLIWQRGIARDMRENVGIELQKVAPRQDEDKVKGDGTEQPKTE